MDTNLNLQSQAEMVVITKDTLANILSVILPPIVNQGIRNFKENELQERLLSPEETCKLFTPWISKPTLESYAAKGYFNKYYLEGRTWYKYSEVIAALKTLKRYSRKETLQS